MFVVSFIIGLVIVISSIFMLRRELNKATYTRSQLLEQSKVYNNEDLLRLLEDLQLSINDMNNSFYEIVNEIEGNVSLNGKEIEDLTKQVEFVMEKLKAQDAFKDHVKTEIRDNLKIMSNIKQATPSSTSSVLEIETIHETLKKPDVSAEKLVLDWKEQSKNDKTIAEITTLRSQGYSLTEIAKKLGMGMGEIQLLINMNLKK